MKQGPRGKTFHEKATKPYESVPLNCKKKNQSGGNIDQFFLGEHTVYGQENIKKEIIERKGKQRKTFGTSKIEEKNICLRCA